MESPLLQLHISSRSVNKHSHHRQFLFLIGWFLKNLLLWNCFAKWTRPIRNKNCLWRPCLLMDRDKMSNLYREPSIDASYQVSVHMAKRLQRTRLVEIDQLETRIATILVSDWLISKKSSPLKLLCQMNRNLVGCICGRSSIKIAHFVPIH
jgi:hypothetical protein